MEKLNELLRDYAQSIRRDDGTAFIHADAIREYFRARPSANETGAEGANDVTLGPAQAAEPVAYTHPDRLKRIAGGKVQCETLWAKGLVDDGDIPLYTAAQADARNGLTDEQREAIEYAITRMDLNVSNRDAYTAAKELRALLKGADHAE